MFGIKVEWFRGGCDFTRSSRRVKDLQGSICSFLNGILYFFFFFDSIAFCIKKYQAIYMEKSYWFKEIFRLNSIIS